MSVAIKAVNPATNSVTESDQTGKQRKSKRTKGESATTTPTFTNFFEHGAKDKTFAGLAAIKRNVEKASLFEPSPTIFKLQDKALSIPPIESNRVKGDNSSLPGEQTPPLHYLNFAYGLLNECLRCRINVKDAFRELVKKKVEFDLEKLSTSKLSPTEAFLLAMILNKKTKDNSDITSGLSLIISALNITKEDAKAKLAPFLRHDKYAWEHLEAAYEETGNQILSINQGENSTTKQTDAQA